MKRLLQSTLARVVLAALVVLLAIAVVGASILTVIENRVEDRIRAAAEASGLAVAWEDFTLTPWGELYLDEVVVKRAGVRVAQFEDLEVDVRLLSRRLFSDKPVVESIEAESGVVAPSAALLGMHAGAGAASADPRTSRGRALRELFGDTPPHIELQNVVVETAHLGGPAKNITIESFETELDDGTWRGEGRLSLQGQSEAFELPSGASVAATFVETERGWQQGPLRVGFDEPMTMRYRGHELTVRAVSLDESFAVTLEDVALDPARLDSKITADAVQVSPISAVLDRNFDDIEKLRIEQPRIEVSAVVVDALRESFSGEPGDASSAPTSWNAALDGAWTRAFALSDRVLTRLDAVLPPLLVVDDAAVVVTAPDGTETSSLQALHVLFAGGDRDPRFSLRTEVILNGEAMGRFTVSTSGGTTASIIGRVENLDARMLQEQLAARGLWPESVSMTGAIDFELEATEDPAGMHPFAGGFIVTELAVLEPRVALDPVVFKRASYQFEGRHSPQSRVAEPSIISHRTGYATLPESQRRGAIEIDRGIVRVGDVSAEFTFDVYGLAALPEHLPARVDLQLDLPPTNAAALWDAIPETIRGPLAGAQFRGELGWTFEAELPLRNASASRWRSTPIIDDFRIVDLPREVDVRRMLGAMEVTLVEPKLDYEATIEIPAPRSDNDPRGQTARPPWGADDNGVKDCGDYVYVPLDYITPHLMHGVLTTEDGTFFSHQGFNIDAIRSAMERNLEEGSFVRGASTISMQLVKNIFLNGRKTLARKFQEAMLVWLMESVVRVPKARILEIYFNVIEYGPRIYGIHHAALYYFGKRPSELTVNEVAWFISTIPGPRLYHRYFERGAISDYWWDHMKGYIDAMYRGGRIDEYELLTARAERPRFRDSDAACAPGSNLNDPDRHADEIEPLRRVMHYLRVVQDRERSDVLRWADRRAHSNVTPTNP